MKLISTLGLLGLMTVANGCLDISSDALRGKYEGSWSKEGSTDVIPIRAELSDSDQSNNGLKAAISCASVQPPQARACQINVELQKVNRTKINIQMTGDVSLDAELKWDHADKNRPCLSDDASELCLTDDQIVISFVDANGKKSTLTLTKVPETVATAALPTSASRNYKLSELLDLAAKRDFATRIEYQRYLEARYNAKAMLLAQLPHVSTGTIANLLGGLNPASLLMVIGDLAPFLLPNRWLQAKEAKLMSKAEYQSAVIIRLNAVLTTETLARGYIRDARAIQSLQAAQTSVNTIYKELALREDLGQLPTGSKPALAHILLAIKQAVLQMQQSIQLELHQLALSIGSNDPYAISGITNDLPRPIARPDTITDGELRSTALKRSHEILQANLIYQTSNLNRKERYFTWLDPSAPPTLGLGVALFPSAKNARAQMEEYHLIEQQIAAALRNKSADLYSTLGFSLKNEALIEESLSVANSRVRIILNHLSFGTDFVLSDLVSALQDQVADEMNRVGNVALYEGTEAQIDRLISRGIYQKYDEPVTVSVADAPPEAPAPATQD